VAGRRRKTATKRSAGDDHFIGDAQTIPTVLAYGQRARGWPTNRQLVWLSVAAALVAVCFLPTPPWRTTTVEMCPECGSTRTIVTTWFGKRTAAPLVYSSCIDRWIVSHEGSHAHAWQFLHASDSSGMRACGLAPPVYYFGHDTFDDLFARAAENEVAKLVQTLRAGSEQQQKESVEKFTTMLLRISDRTTPVLEPEARRPSSR
jgi:hypothetical protein